MKLYFDRITGTIIMGIRLKAANHIVGYTKESDKVIYHKNRMTFIGKY